MRARSALFDVYGDHLRTRGNQAPVSALVRLLGPLGISPPAVRTAISRMVLQGWLEPVTLAGARGYRATSQAIARLDEAGDRIYARRSRDWDGRWRIAVVTGAPGLRSELTWLGYAALAPGVWVSPWPHPQVPGLVERAGGTLTAVEATQVTPPPLAAWDLASLGSAYAAWLAAQVPSTDVDDRSAFAARFRLVHEWRKFLFSDPGLPDPLLPPDWPGRRASAFFTAEAERLKPAADRFVAACLGH